MYVAFAENKYLLIQEYDSLVEYIYGLTSVFTKLITDNITDYGYSFIGTENIIIDLDKYDYVYSLYGNSTHKLTKYGMDYIKRIARNDKLLVILK